MSDFLNALSILILLPIKERQQKVLQAGAHREGHGIGHGGDGKSAGGGGGGGATGAGAGQTVGYGEDGTMGQVAIPQGVVQGYTEL